MEAVDVKLPSELLRVANLEGSSLSEEAARLLALELYREDQGLAGTRCGALSDALGGFHGFCGETRCSPATVQL
jgi:hypothetical protein